MMQPITFKEIGQYAKDQLLEFLFQPMQKQVKQTLIFNTALAEHNSAEPISVRLS
jgi:hypothetical protein